jgi:hypothetical protein
MDVLISGKEAAVTRARAAIASRLTTSAAHLTVSAEAQAIEDRLMALAIPPGSLRGERPRFDEVASAEFAAIDEKLASIKVPYDEWEVLYRQRLQVERDLRAGAMAGEAVIGASSPGTEGAGEALARAGRVVRQGVAAFVDAATDRSTIEALDRLAGPRWRIAAQAADVVVVAARAAVAGSREPNGTSAGEPIAAGTTADGDETDPLDRPSRRGDVR